MFSQLFLIILSLKFVILYEPVQKVCKKNLWNIFGNKGFLGSFEERLDWVKTADHVTLHLDTTSNILLASKFACDQALYAKCLKHMPRHLGNK